MVSKAPFGPMRLWGDRLWRFSRYGYEDLSPRDCAGCRVEQLFNATDSEVLDVFPRINAYGLSLNRQELRHGKYRAFRNEG